MRRISFTRLSLKIFWGISAAALVLGPISAAQEAKPDQKADAKPAAQQPPPEPPRPSSADLSRDETPGKAVMRILEGQEYEVRSSAEAMPADKWD